MYGVATLLIFIDYYLYPQEKNGHFRQIGNVLINVAFRRDFRPISDLDYSKSSNDLDS